MALTAYARRLADRFPQNDSKRFPGHASPKRPRPDWNARAPCTTHTWVPSAAFATSRRRGSRLRALYEFSQRPASAPIPVRGVMKNRHILALVLNLGWILSVEGQTTFKNLGFEVGVPVPIPDDPLGRVYAHGALPHWTAFIGTEEQTAVFFNKRSFSSSAISILNYRCTFPGYIAGRYT